MSSNAGGSGGGGGGERGGPPAATKRITIEADPRQKTIYENPNIVKLFRILLTLFYGQFFANAIYDNLIRGIPYVVGTASAFGIVRVTLGIVIIALVVFSMFAIWKKIWPLIMGSAMLLIIVSIISLIVNIIDLIQRRDRQEISGPEVSSEIAEMIVEFIFRLAAVALQFVMVKFLKVSYSSVPTSA